MAYDGKLMSRALRQFEEDKQRREEDFRRRENELLRRIPRLAEMATTSCPAGISSRETRSALL